ncbi:proto-oncogene serine/threonine-protein kinase mos [Hoplias malabaricus]|uniref:proto-oncogene serine/threonine-protein kinase mos n=1 Tax=Hoplias malabaricus TaxID=27720 RepID=UPI0034618EAF
MPSPLPVSRLLPRVFGIGLGARSSPLRGHAGASTLRVPSAAGFYEQQQQLARRLWSSSSVQWRELRGLERIGAGGFGLVFKGSYFGETVAVKRVRRARNNALASRQSFWAELNAVHLQHDNVVRVIAATTASGGDDHDEECHVGTIVMEFAGDVNLQQVIYDHDCVVEPLPLALCVRYATDIASALHHLHAHGVAHLDVKPANVLVSPAGVCKLADFGCSLRLEREHEEARPLEIGGTYTHRAPELLRGERVTARADVYSYGVTLWQLLTREPPYRGERQYVMYAVVAQGLRPELDLAVFRSAVGCVIKDLLVLCWSAEPNTRPSAADLLSELKPLREHCLTESCRET